MTLKEFALEQSKLLKEDCIANQNAVIQNITNLKIHQAEPTREDIEKIINYMREDGADFKMLNESYDNQKELSVLAYIKSMAEKKLKIKG
jgi:hypothetical protein